MGSSGFAIGDATDLGVQSAWLIETVGIDTAWRHLPEHYDELVNVYYPKCRSLFIAMCDSCASTNSPTIDPPEIQSISQTPEPNNVFADNVVQIKVTVSYNAVGIKTVSLNYSLNGAENCTINMTQAAQNVWNCQIPPQPAGTAIAYSVTVENNAGNTTTSQSTSYTYSYIVTPEFPNAPMTILMLLSAATAVIMVQHRRKRQTAQ